MHENTLYIKKLDLKSPSMKDMTIGINEAFENTESYFRRTIKENKIIIGKKLTPYKEAELKREIVLAVNDPTLSPTCKSRNVKFGYRSKDSNKSTEKYNTRVSARHIMNSLSPNHHHHKNAAYDRKKHITDEELNQLFENYKQVQEKNNQHHNDFIKQFEEKHFRNILQLQEETLKRSDSHSRAMALIEKRLLKKSKKSPKELLTNRTSTFRILQEMRDKNNQQKSLNASIKDQWQLNLRCGKDFKGMKQVWVNSGSASSPKWGLSFERIPSLKEKVRDVAQSGLPEEKSFLNNPYLKEKNNYHSLMNSFEELQGLSVKGKNLLQSELEQSKCIKGRKRIIIPIIDNESKNTKEFAKDLSLKNIFEVKTINSCRMLHNPIKYNVDSD